MLWHKAQGAGGAGALSWDTETKITSSDAATGDRFGWSVSISGDYAIVGAYLDDDNGADSGSAYIYFRDNGVWTQQAKLTASDGAAGDYFGVSVSISGDIAVIGAWRDNSDTGAAYVFTRSGTAWSQQAKLTASDASAGQAFGRYVAIDGDSIIAGVSLFSSTDRAAYVFTRSGATWSQQAKLTVSGDLGFSFSVDIDGDSAVVGEREGFAGPGKAHVFTRSAGVWSLQDTVSPSDGATNDNFGTSVSIAGDLLIVGSNFDDDVGSGTGAAYVFVRSGTTWSQQSKLTASDAVAGGAFGGSVSIEGDYAVVGSTGVDAAYVFRTSNWTEIAKLEPSDTPSSFGYSVGLSGTGIVIGDYNNDGGATSSGSAYIFET